MNSTSLTPVDYQREDDIYIMSELQLNCMNTSFPMLTRWTLHNCSIACSSAISFPSNIKEIQNEIFIPAQSLLCGIYELRLTMSSQNVSSSMSVYIRINPSRINVNLIPYGTSMVTHGYLLDLTLDPGQFSIDPDTTVFDAQVWDAFPRWKYALYDLIVQEWNYEYHCRIYGLYDFPNILGVMLTIGNPRVDTLNPSCFSNQSSKSSSSSCSSIHYPSLSRTSNPL